MRQLLLKQTVIYRSFESSQHMHMPSATVLSHIVLYHLSDQCMQQTTASELPRSVWDWGCSILSRHIVFCLVFSKLIDLLVSPLNLFIVLVFVSRVFSDWCSDNYKKACAPGIPVDWDDSHRAIVVLKGWLKKTNKHLGVSLKSWRCKINGTNKRVACNTISVNLFKIISLNNISFSALGSDIDTKLHTSLITFSTYLFFLIWNKSIWIAYL